MKKTIFLISLCSFFSIASSVHAQDLSNGTALGIPIHEKVHNGDIISSASNDYRLSNSPYDSQIYGVVTLKPALYLTDSDNPKDIPVISIGEVLVRVSSINGNIQVGDYITSSTIPGAGEKAIDNGFVLGRAEQAYASNDHQKIGLIRVILHPHYAQIDNNLTHTFLNTISLGFTAATTTPLGVIRYFVAGMITLLSFFFGFRFFARASNRGVEAIGRNPLAKQAILLSVFINTIITISIMLLGVAISYVILVL